MNYDLSYEFYHLQIIRSQYIDNENDNENTLDCGVTSLWGHLWATGSDSASSLCIMTMTGRQY